MPDPGSEPRAAVPGSGRAFSAELVASPTVRLGRPPRDMTTVTTLSTPSERDPLRSAGQWHGAQLTEADVAFDI
jgi:hypothetical protein